MRGRVLLSLKAFNKRNKGEGFESCESHLLSIVQPAFGACMVFDCLGMRLHPRHCS